jgi:hypothetical protein
MKKHTKTTPKTKVKNLIKLEEIKPRILHSENVRKIEKNHTKEMLEIIKNKPFDIEDSLSDLPITFISVVLIKHKIKNKPLETQKEVVRDYKEVYWDKYEQSPNLAEQVANRWLEDSFKVV